jgi:Peptidase A4 family
MRQEKPQAKTSLLRAGLFGIRLLLPAAVLIWLAGPWPGTIAPIGGPAVQPADPWSQARMFRWRDAKGMPQSGPHNETLSNNWSGYGVSGGTYTAVQGTWVVPSVSYQSYSGSPKVEASSTWIGIGGQESDPTLIQTGTMQVAGPTGETQYFAWYEILPDTEVPISPKQYPVKAGDTITATIKCTAACGSYALSTWLITLTNANRWPKPYSITLQYASSLTSVEWIVEGPCINNCSSSEPGFAYLPNYGSTTFSAISVNNANPNLSRSPNGIIMKDPSGKAMSSPSDPVGGNSFTVNFTI